MQKKVQHVFLVGAKSLGNYGGYETFIDKLTEYHQNNPCVKYHVACKANGSGFMDEKKLEGVSEIVKKKEKTVSFTYHNAHCFKIKVPERLGSAQAIVYDLLSLEECCKIIKKDKLTSPIIYMMACRIGPFIPYYYHKIHQLGGRLYLNPDGHEWKRQKWNKWIQKYWKLSERMMVKWSDYVICDSIHIEEYIHQSYDGRGFGKKNPRTAYIAYGAELKDSVLADQDEVLLDWYEKNGLKADEYYLIVGRFVPENNFEIMIQEFQKSHSEKKLAIITTENPKYFDELEKKLHVQSDSRVRFVGTVYDQELLKKIREKAYGYFHGHEVGGTNPSLLEAMGSTKLNLLLDVCFNREVGQDAALYWNKKRGNLSKLIDECDKMDPDRRRKYGELAKERIHQAYTWNYISDRYSHIFQLGE